MKHPLFIIAILATLLPGCAQNNPGATGGPRCKIMGWNPELYTFYGAPDKIVQKLARIPAKLSERRVFLEVTQGTSGAEVELYEQEEGLMFTVTTWTTNNTSRLMDDIDKAITVNKGNDCVGTAVRRVLTKDLGENHKKVSRGVALPASPKATFAPSVLKQVPGSYIKITVILLC